MTGSGYLLDTNAISEAVKSQQNAGYMHWLNTTDDESMYLSCLTIGEIQKGVSLTNNTTLSKRLNSYLGGLFDAFSGRILSLDYDSCVLWGALMVQAQKAGKTPPVIDTFLAAQAVQYNLTLVTRNIKDFRQFADLQVLCPWT
jgi:predicted nucleic acid-binding protein